MNSGERISRGDLAPARERGEAKLDPIAELEQTAMGFLDTAQTAVDAYAAYYQQSTSLTPDYFKSTGISSADLELVLKLGLEVAALAQSDSEVTTRYFKHHTPTNPQRLEQLTEDYQPIDPSHILPDGPNKKLEDFLTKFPPLRIDKDNLDLLISDLQAATKKEFNHSVANRATFIGLGVIRLAQLLSMEEVKAGLVSNRRISQGLLDRPPIVQAVYLVSTYFISNENPSEIRRFLQDTLHGSNVSKQDHQKLIEEHTRELQLFAVIKDPSKQAETTVGAYHGLIELALSQAAKIAAELTGKAPVPPKSLVSVDDEQLKEQLATEEQVVASSRRIAERAREITSQCAILKSSYTGQPLNINIPSFPTAEHAIQKYLRALEAEKSAGALATARALEAATQQQIAEELSTLQAQYFMPRSKLKKIPGNNELTARLIRGEVGDNKDKAPAVDKDMAYDIASLIYTLKQSLETQNRNKVFDRLLDAVEKERDLAQSFNGSSDTARRLTMTYEWITNNAAFMRLSEEATLKQIGEELATYAKARRHVLGTKLEHSTRIISPQTIRAIEAARIEAEQLDIRAFPPGVSNIEELLEDAQDLATRPGSKFNIETLYWDRLIALDGLSAAYTERGYETQLFRLLPGSLRQRFPYYALVIDRPSRVGRPSKKVIVAENPREDNATYVFEEIDPDFAKWTEMVLLDKDSVKELGGRGLTHTAQSDIKQHFQRVNDEAVLRLTIT